MPACLTLVHQLAKLPYETIWDHENGDHTPKPCSRKDGHNGRKTRWVGGPIITGVRSLPGFSILNRDKQLRAEPKTLHRKDCDS
jgi:hypothetical protein